MDDNSSHYDVLVIGGGAAGLSAGLTLARARRDVLVLDAGEPRNAPAEGVHGFLTRDGVAPAELTALGRAEVTGYGGTVRSGRAVAARRTARGFAVRTADGDELTARRLILAGGVDEVFPDVDGLRARWGRDVFHCPYCHGWEVRDTAIGVLATGPHAVHQALLLRQWSDDVTLFLHTSPDPTDEQWERLAARGVAVVDGEVSGVQVTGDALSGVRLASGRVVARESLVVLPHAVAEGPLLDGLGIGTVELAPGVATHVPTDPSGRTAVPGVWAAGNLRDPMATVVASAASGTMAAAAVNGDLVEEDTDRAVARRRDPFSAASESRVAALVASERAHGLTGVG
ncbi:NAD(P)/FAD-dependent oxidoreductase [Pseudonocardia sp. KRD291]|uniref:NAD(P)/FAD-dependent oxidoreductase n=1 Tax=Pseudonocardia sp. KRD291 TaxID=2792007 RepID=UPI001C4A0A9B|nr:NAD(P)/FAD-dependent oxidoreductase [Pseudonocardia sp. KRD291]MBW0106814.1 NAD(P)/FAD-dependent oxidoreductase [Pseudonocardia sp. KRD291]